MLFRSDERRIVAVDILVKRFFARPAAMFLQPCVTGVANDRQQPRLAVVTVETVEEFICAKAGFLRDVLRVRVVSGKPSRQVVGRVEMRLEIGRASCRERV